MISTRISYIRHALFLIMAFATVCAILIAIWIAMGIVLHWLLPGIDLGIATMICSLAFVFVILAISASSFFSKALSIASLYEDDEEDEEDDEEKNWEREQTRHWNQKIPNQRPAQRRRNRNK